MVKIVIPLLDQAQSLRFPLFRLGAAGKRGQTHASEAILCAYVYIRTYTYIYLPIYT